MKVSISTIKECLASSSEKDRVLNDLSVFLYLKSKTKRGCFYRYSVNSLSNKSKLSRTLIRKRINSFIGRGWCEMHHGNLIFKGFKLERGFNRKIELKFNNIKELREQLYLALIKEKMAQFDKLKKVSSDLKSPTSTTSLKAARAFKKKHFKSGYDAPKQNESYSISFKGLGKMFNCSPSNAHRIVKEMNGRKLRTQSDIIFLMSHSSKEKTKQYLSLRDGTFNTSKGIYARTRTKYELI